jgi:hypothetical protein
MLRLPRGHFGQPGVDLLGAAGVCCLDQVEVTPGRVAVVGEQRAAGVQGAHDVVGAASGHDRVIVAWTISAGPRS